MDIMYAVSKKKNPNAASRSITVEITHITCYATNKYAYSIGFLYYVPVPVEV
jgi:hypothetical protein